MKVMMIGHSDSGKTTYMASMYTGMVHALASNSEFGILAENEADHDALFALGNKLLLQGVYPAATDIRSEYNFRLLHKQEPVLPFTWIDYRGNALNESASSTALQALNSDLGEADAVLVFIDAMQLYKSHGRRNSQIGRLQSVLTSAINGIDRVLPIGIVLSKYDAIDSLEMNFDLGDPIRGLMEAIAASKKLHGAFLPTGCGRQMAAGVELPLYFVLHIGIAAMLHRMHDSIEELKAAAAAQFEQSNIFSEMWHGFIGELSHIDRGNAHIEEANRIVALYNSLVPPAEALGEQLNDVFRF